MNNNIKNAINNRNNTYYGIYSDIGTALEPFTTLELAEYFIKNINCESALRYFLEQQITIHEINKLKY